MKKSGPSWQQHFPLVTQRETWAMCRHWEFWHKQVLYVHTSPEQQEFKHLNQGDNFQTLQRIWKISESSALTTCTKSPSSLTSSSNNRYLHLKTKPWPWLLTDGKLLQLQDTAMLQMSPCFIQRGSHTSYWRLTLVWHEVLTLNQSPQPSSGHKEQPKGDEAPHQIAENILPWMDNVLHQFFHWPPQLCQLLRDTNGTNKHTTAALHGKRNFVLQDLTIFYYSCCGGSK